METHVPHKRSSEQPPVSRQTFTILTDAAPWTHRDHAALTQQLRKSLARSIKHLFGEKILDALARQRMSAHAYRMYACSKHAYRTHKKKAGASPVFFAHRNYKASPSPNTAPASPFKSMQFRPARLR